MKKQKHTREEKLQAFGRLLDIQDRLRSECPWDRKQTNESLRPYTIEEVFELCDALMEGNHKEICKELGDVMEHVVFYAMLGEENGDFDIADVCNAQSDKLMFRHDFIDWNANGDWTVSNPDLMIDEQGQVVYKVSGIFPNQLQLQRFQRHGNSVSSRKRMGMRPFSRVFQSRSPR